MASDFCITKLGTPCIWTYAHCIRVSEVC